MGILCNDVWSLCMALPTKDALSKRKVAFFISPSLSLLYIQLQRQIQETWPLRLQRQTITRMAVWLQKEAAATSYPKKHHFSESKSTKWLIGRYRGSENFLYYATLSSLHMFNVVLCPFLFFFLSFFRGKWQKKNLLNHRRTEMLSKTRSPSWKESWKSPIRKKRTQGLS